MTRDDGASRARLLPHHADLVAASAIAPEVAAARGYRSVETRAEPKRLGFGDAQCRVPALLIPVRDAFGQVATYQLRPDEPRVKGGKPLKYETPAGTRMVLDVPPAARARLGDPSVPLWITEGARKADAAVSAGLCCVAILGVWNWRGTNGDGGKVALPDWEQIALNDRAVCLVFDSDVVTKPAVHAALSRLKGFLEAKDAHVLIVYLPAADGGGKVGLDDYLAAGHGVDDLLALASPELRWPPEDEADGDAPYAATPAGLVWRKPTQNGPVDVRLANFSARIVGDIVEDDGAEERRLYEVEAALRDRTLRVAVPAAQFAGMTWVADRLGAGANFSPGMGLKDHLRFAIQVLSGDIPERRVFAHTGWRLVDGVWLYLHAGGALGPDGLVPGVEVALSGPLGRFRLPDPPAGDDLVTAVRAAVALLDLLPADVAVPLLGAAWLAPLRELLGDDAPDFVAWLHGPSGTFKSEVLALAQAFYGDFSRQSLPANFSATANAVERFAFAAKDALLAVDDYHPAGDPREAQAMNQVAGRLLRGAGNAAGRARMRADTSLRPALVPRCVAVASGERLPEGHSTVARMFPVAVEPGSISPSKLAEAQDRRHLYPLATAAYVRHLAGRFEGLRAELPSRFRALRREAQVAGGHRREPGQVAHLLLGLEAFLGFAVEAGAIAPEDREHRLRDARRVLLTHARGHALEQAEEAPHRLFLRLLGDGFAGKRAYLEAKHGGAPLGAERWGWEGVIRSDRDGVEREELRHLPTGQLVGALDGDWVLLYPEATHQFVAAAARAAGRVFPVDQNSLVRRLAEAGLIAVETEGDERRLKVNAWINGATRRVVKLRRDALEGSSPEDREGREDREGGEGEDRSGNGEEHADSAAPLPSLPGLPGFGEEETGVEAGTGEVVEWSA